MQPNQSNTDISSSNGSNPRRGPPSYVIGPELNALLAGLSEQKNGMAAMGTMRAIGDYCADHLLDGVITRGQLRSLGGYPDRRKLMRHVSWLVTCGALTPLGEAPARAGLAPSYVLTNYLNHNWSREKRLAHLEEMRASSRKSSAASRSKNASGDYEGTKLPSSPKTDLQMLDIVEESHLGDTIGTGSISVSFCSSTGESAHEQTALGSKICSNLGLEDGAEGPQSNLQQEAPQHDAALTATEKYRRLAERAVGGKLPEISHDPEDEDAPGYLTRNYAKHLKLQGKELKLTSSENLSASERKGASNLPDYLPAKINSDPTPVNAHDVRVFLKTALGEEPTEVQQVMLFRRLRQIGARAAELKYAAWYLKHFTSKGGKVKSHIGWAHGVIVRQRQHRDNAVAELKALSDAA